MQCSNCGKCCEQTEMLLSRIDVLKLEKRGYRSAEFTVNDRNGLTRLRNVGGWCYFYDSEAKQCRVYEHRPLGCSIYPVVYSMNEGVTTDELCPMRHTVSQQELKMKEGTLIKHLREIMRQADHKHMSIRDPFK